MATSIHHVLAFIDCRSENSVSPNHLAEFTMLEAEEAFIDTTEQLAARIDNMVKSVTRTLLNTCHADIQASAGSGGTKTNTVQWIEKEFPRLTYDEASQILSTNSSKLKTPFDPTNGLNREQELFLVNHAQSPLFVIDWPRNLKPFYMRQSVQNPDYVSEKR